jgi:5-methylcytosine-specific restriction protein A
VALVDITRPAVLEAVLEFDRLGRDEFLRTTGFHRARSYYLELNGRLYDSKAIAGYAHGRAQGTPLRPEDFSGGNATVATVLRTLGFDISVRAPGRLDPRRAGAGLRPGRSQRLAAGRRLRPPRA